MNLWLSQVNYQYGENAFLPYSAGRLWAYARQYVEQWELAGFICFRDPIEDVIERMRDKPPSLFAASCYIWNWNYTLLLAAAVRDEWPQCLIVLGGPQVPNDGEAFLSENPWVDVLVHGEGEEAFRQILCDTDWQKIPGVTTVFGNTGKGNRLPDLKALRSPYLDGLFDELIADTSKQWHVSQETNRGCPYSCTFCDWGSAVFTKVREIPMDQILGEVTWAGQHNVDLFYNCDANFGMLKRDVDIADRLIETKHDFGYPNKFRAAYAKKTTPRLFDLATRLSDAGMSKGVTLSVQSMDPHVLNVVKRRNMNLEEITRLVEAYQKQDVPTYTEIILGLPGESYEGFVEGLDILLRAGQHDGINIYPLIVLPNSELNDPDYRALHKIETVTLPMMLLHGSPSDEDPAPETYDLVVSTATMSHEQWKAALLYGWIVQGLHCLPLLRLPAGSAGNYRVFYTSIMNMRGNSASLIARELQRLWRMIDDVLAGRATWNLVDERFGTVTWPPEEMLFLRCALNAEQILDEIGVDEENKRRTLASLPLPSDYGGDTVEWAKQVVWYGRKGGNRLKPDEVAA